MTIFFGPRWHAPMLDGAEHVATPVGAPCLHCRERIEEGDQGLFLTVVREGFSHASCEPIHAECEAIGIVGHRYGVCTHTGFDTTTRAAARELWRRLGHAT